MTLYTRLRDILHAARSASGRASRVVLKYQVTPLLEELQDLLECQARQSKESVDLWACLNFRHDPEGLGTEAQACWVGTWKAEDCPNCGGGIQVEAVTLEMDKPSRAAVWLAICAGKLQLIPFGDDRWD